MIWMAWMSPLAKWNLNDIYHLAVETLIFIITFNWQYCQNVQYKSKKNNSEALKKIYHFTGVYCNQASYKLKQGINFIICE